MAHRSWRANAYVGKATRCPERSTAFQSTGAPDTCSRANAVMIDSDTAVFGRSTGKNVPSRSPNAAGPIEVSVASGPISTNTVTPCSASTVTASAKRTGRRACSLQ